MTSISKNNRIEIIDIDNTFIKVDNIRWINPKTTSLRVVRNTFLQNFVDEAIDNHTIILDPSTLKISVNEDVISNSKSSIKSIAFNNFDECPSKGPDNLPLFNTFISVDENFLYVWVKSKWKRIPLLNW